MTKPTKTCVACRTRHVRCDGEQPCSRCAASKSECLYVASQRGKRRHAQQQPEFPTDQDLNAILQGSNVSPASCFDSCPEFAPWALQDSSDELMSMSNSLGVDLSPPTAPLFDMNWLPDPASITTESCKQIDFAAGDVSIMPSESAMVETDRYLASFYRYAFAAHPFVLPHHDLLRLRDLHDSMRTVLAAMRWIGSLYVDVQPRLRSELYQQAHDLIYDPRAPRDGFLVQAMLLLLVGLDGNADQRKAREVLENAEQLAIEIGLHRASFASLHGRGVPILEESWRRTWWSLYSTEAMVTAAHRRTDFALCNVASDVGLPCEEDQYLSGDIPDPLSFDDLEARGFATEELAFSSFAYLILSAHTLGFFLRKSRSIDHLDDGTQTEARLASWSLSLPANKRDALRNDGQPDEIMFQALMMRHAISIMVHEVHAKLDKLPAITVNHCMSLTAEIGAQPSDMHTFHAITSARAISRMVMCHHSVVSHVHFFTCVVTLSSIVHLGRWALMPAGNGDHEALRELLRLNMGALKERSRVWKAAAISHEQVASVAKDLFRMKQRGAIR
ncbi:uncharacterized protein F5Z01DRAFT_330694 [Emericellopsis atlantica]|uniref:Zn(2)-C6 fungal-type domain-containing protein n=1 Tax=Emericellopsis atlantica TaxID=2614577 RepID=A0A9P8CLI5_9HYPO|nr:uncharacterized protein F5Z01DRAFT_330694 [Emericellopsis atlantica]KAG9251055.1 hypothetical protein F5Z01DRAFT_330694 [Emericellopsis atlantica]